MSIVPNQADFDAAAPLLNERAREWLSRAVRTLDAEHAWLPRLGGH